MAMVAGLEGTVPEEVAELGGDRDLTGMRPGELVRGCEGDVGTEQRFDAHGRRDAGRPAQSIRIRQQERPDRTHHLRPVEKGQPFLGLERQRLQTGLAQSDHRRHDRPAEFDLAPPDQGQRQVRERRQVP